MASIKEESELRESLIGQRGVAHPRRQARRAVLPGRCTSAVTAKMTFLGTFKTNVAMLCLARRLFVHYTMTKRAYCTDVHLRGAARTAAGTSDRIHAPWIALIRLPRPKEPPALCVSFWV
jgi:hypothetical protein